MKDIIKFPVSYFERIKNSRGKLSASCIITDRWIIFHPNSTELKIGDVVWLDVMTSVSGKDKKICELAVCKEDILKAISNIAKDKK